MHGLHPAQWKPERNIKKVTSPFPYTQGRSVPQQFTIQQKNQGEQCQKQNKQKQIWGF